MDNRVQEIFIKQQQNLQRLKNETAKQRIAKLKKLEKEILKQRTNIQTALHNDFGKAAMEVDVTEIYPVVSEIRHLKKNLQEWMLPEEVATPLTYIGSSSKIIREPKGNCLIITPWNYPFNLALMPIAIAVAAGNAVILKPSEFTPNINQLIKQILGIVFGENEIAVCEGAKEMATQLLAMPFNHIHFTGSSGVGKIIMKAAAEQLASVTLELGGKSPVIIDRSANLKKAAKRICWGKFLNAGQTCIAPDYILVHNSKKEEFVSLLTEEIRSFYGSTVLDSPDYCRMIHNDHFERIEQLKNDAISKGAHILFGGSSDKASRFIEPCLLDGVTDQMTIMQEEIFGPLLPIVSFTDLDETIKQINAKPKPLAMYIFAKKDLVIEHLLNNTSAGSSAVNDVIIQLSQPNLPFGGINNSGIGRSHGKWGFLDFSNERATLRQQSPYSSAEMLYPPYNANKKKLMNATLKWL